LTCVEAGKTGGGEADVKKWSRELRGGRRAAGRPPGLGAAVREHRRPRCFAGGAGLL